MLSLLSFDFRSAPLSRFEKYSDVSCLGPSGLILGDNVKMCASVLLNIYVVLEQSISITRMEPSYRAYMIAEVLVLESSRVLRMRAP